jgi:p-cumate 2,3-dioxygenase subunit alpha
MVLAKVRRNGDPHHAGRIRLPAVGCRPAFQEEDAMIKGLGTILPREARALIDDMVVEDSAAGTFRVNRRAFVDQAVFELERKMIFDHCWLYVGHVSEVALPSAFVTRTVAGRRLILNRDRSGKLNCFLNTCSHRGSILCREKAGKRGSFACPYHGWLYNDEGALIKIPGKESFSPAVLNDETLGMTRVPRLAEYCGFVFVNFDAEAPSLETYLDGAAEVLEFITSQGEEGMEICTGAQEYSTNANWKLLLENSADGYHAGPTHISYFDFITARDGAFVPEHASQGDVETLVGVPSVNIGMRALGNGHSVIETQGPWARPCARWVPGWGEDSREEIAEISRRMVARMGSEKAYQITNIDRNTLIFPNFVVNDLMAITVRTFFPVRPNYMEINAWALAPIGENLAARERRLQSFVEFYGPAGFASPDDVEMLDLCQQGYANYELAEWNDISKGMLSEKFASDDEEQMRVFWRKWKDMMMRVEA